jgi:mannose-6-phosphate isomerase-like protein (cupin superfamily)
MTATSPLDLVSTFVVIGPQHAATPVAVTPTLFEQLDRQHEQFEGRLLVSSFAFDANWTTWEMHPGGDEIVCLLSGRATLVLDRDGREDTVELAHPGAFAIVPKGAWHTARTDVPTKMLFVTPGQGTRNRPVARRPAPSTQHRFDVFGKIMIVDRTESGWRLRVQGSDGKWGPANVVIPEFVPEHELAQYLDDVFHESATPGRPCVLRLPS